MNNPGFWALFIAMAGRVLTRVPDPATAQYAGIILPAQVGKKMRRTFTSCIFLSTERVKKINLKSPSGYNPDFYPVHMDPVHRCAYGYHLLYEHHIR